MHWGAKKLQNLWYIKYIGICRNAKKLVPAAPRIFVGATDRHWWLTYYGVVDPLATYFQKDFSSARQATFNFSHTHHQLGSSNVIRYCQQIVQVRIIISTSKGISQGSHQLCHLGHQSHFKFITWVITKPSPMVITVITVITRRSPSLVSSVILVITVVVLVISRS